MTRAPFLLNDIAVICRAINAGDFESTTLLAMADALTELGKPWGLIWPWQWMAATGRRPEINKGRSRSRAHVSWMDADIEIIVVWEWSRNELLPSGLPIPWEAWNVSSWRRRSKKPLSAYRNAARKLEECYPSGRGLLTP